MSAFHKNFIFSIVFLLFNISNSFSQNITFEHLSSSDGLAHNNVNCLIKDSHGYMWFGTEDGLNKFDGYSFTIYTHSEDDSLSLPSSFITYLLEDKDGLLWIGTVNGISCFNPKKESFKNFSREPGHKNYMIAKEITKIFEASNGHILIGSHEGLSIYDKKNDTITNIPNKEGKIKGKTIFEIISDRTNKIWFFTSGQQATVFDPSTNKYEYFELPLTSNYLTQVSKDETGNFYISCYNCGITKFDPITKKVIDVWTVNQFNSSNIRGSFWGANEKLWVATDGGGINIIDTKTSKIRVLKNNSTNLSSLSGDAVYKVLIDNLGITWVTIYNKGIDIYNPNKYKFELFEFDISNLEGIGNKTISSVYEDSKGRIWIGSDGDGLYLFNRNNNSFKKYRHDPNNNNTLSTNKIICLGEDNNGNILAGTWQGGLNVLDVERNLVTRIHYKDKQESYPPNIWDIITISDGKVLFFSQGNNENSGVMEYDSNNKTYIKSRKFDIKGSFIKTMYEDSKQNLWIGTKKNGIWIYPKQGEPKNIKFKEGSNNCLSNNDVRAIHEDNNGIFWIGTEGGGVNKFDEQANTFKVYTDKNGLCSNSIDAILQDKKGKLWISSSKGLNQFDPKNEEFIKYSPADGLQKASFSSSAIESKTGEFYFAGRAGFNVFFPDSIKNSTYQPQIVLKSLKILNKPVNINDKSGILKEHIDYVNKIVILHKHSILNIEYAALNYTNLEKVKYAYIMEGFDDDWHYVDTKREALYTNLDPGKYTFMVKATNHDGVWSNNVKKLEIIILPPWWQTWWFRTISLLAVLIALFSTYKLKVRSIKHQKKVLEKKVEDATLEVKSRNDKLRNAQKMLKSIMDDVKNQLGGASEQLVDATNSQASSAEQISASMEEMASGITQNASGTMQMLENAMHVETETEETVDIVSRTLSSIKDISEEIAFISEFARMTNLLSLNAAIEAARAGKHGKSFAVVASQVKKLADQSAEVAIKIHQLSETGLNLSQEANTKINHLQDYIKNIVSTITTINQSTQHQSAEANNINDAITQISMNTSKISELANKLDVAINSLSLGDN